LVSSSKRSPFSFSEYRAHFAVKSLQEEHPAVADDKIMKQALSDLAL